MRTRSRTETVWLSLTAGDPGRDAGFLDALPDAVLGVDRDGRIVLANSQADVLFGYGSGELVGQVVEVLVPDAARDVHEALRRGFFDAPRMRPMSAARDVEGRRRDGSTFSAEIALALASDGEAPIAVATVRDVGERLARERAAREAALREAQVQTRLREAAREAERALREAQAQTQALFDHVPAGLALRGADGRFRLVNEYAARVFGTTAHEMVGRFAGDYHSASNALRLAQSEAAVRTSGEKVLHELSVIDADGVEHDYRLVRFPVADADGQLTGVGSFAYEITDLRRAERERERMLEELQEAELLAGLGSWRWDPAHGARMWSAGMYAICGRDPAAGPHGDADAFAQVHPDDVVRVKDAFARLFGGGGALELDYRLITPTGTRTVRAIARTDPLAPGCFRGTLQDVSAVREVEQALREQTEALGAVLDGAPIGMAVARADGRFERVNAALCALLGYSEQELLAMSFADITHPADQALSTEWQQRVLAGDRDVAPVQKRYLRRDGSALWANVSLAGVGSRAARRVIAQIEDVTAARAATEALARLASVVQDSNDAIITVTLDGTITTWNSAAERMYGYRAEEMIGRSSAIIAPGEREQGEQDRLRARVARGESVGSSETVRRRKDGTLIDISITISPVCDADGVVVGVSMVTRDITAIKQATRRTLAVAEERFRSAFENSPIGMALVRPRRRLRAGQQRAVRDHRLHARGVA